MWPHILYNEAILMIGKLKGTLSEIFESEALIETTSGVFYRVYVTPQVVAMGVGEAIVEIYTYLQVREDDLTLFGFETHEIYRLFTYLIAIDGVGPKTAFGMICMAKPAELREAVLNNDVAYFQKMKGIGKKTAQRILIDLSARFGSEFDVTAGQETQDDVDAQAALVSLGFTAKDARKALAGIDGALPLEERIRLALQGISRK